MPRSTSTHTASVEPDATVKTRSGEFDDGTAYGVVEIAHGGVGLNIYASDPDLAERMAAAWTTVANEIRDLHDAARVGAA